MKSIVQYLIPSGNRCAFLAALLLSASAATACVAAEAPDDDGNMAASEDLAEDALALSGGPPVLCYVFDDGYANMAGPSDAIFVPAPNKACIPGGSGICRRWLGRCFTNDGAKLPVKLQVFDDGATNQSYASDAVYISGPNSACVPGGPTGVCRRWFGLEAAYYWKYAMPANFYLFNDGYSSMIGPTGAIFWNGSQLCMPGGSTGICRKWFGRGELQ